MPTGFGGESSPCGEYTRASQRVALASRVLFPDRTKSSERTWDREMARKKPALASIKDARDHARAIVETIQVPLLLLNRQLRVVTANKSFYQTFHARPREVVQHAFFSLNGGQWDVRKLREQIDNLLRQGVPVRGFEPDHQFVGAGRRQLMLDANRVFLDGAETQMILISIEDVTERKGAEQALKQSEATFRALIESASQAILAVSAGGTIVLINRATEEMFGYPREELLQQPLDVLVPEYARDRHRQYHGEYYANPRRRPMGIGLDLQARRKDGSLFPVEIGLDTFESPQGRCGVAFATDISQRKRLEKAEEINRQEIRALASRLLTVQEEERRRVSREIHDDLGQQLAALTFDLGGLAAEPFPEAARVQLRALQGRLVKLSEAARHLAYQLHPSILEDLGLAAALRALCEEFSRHNGIVVKYRDKKVPRELPIEVTSCLYRVAQAALQNVIQHSGVKCVYVTLSGQDRAVMLSIRDDGAGFDPVSAKGRGGLGLVSMEERVRLVGGTLIIESKPGRGTRIAAVIPLAGGRT